MSTSIDENNIVQGSGLHDITCKGRRAGLCALYIYPDAQLHVILPEANVGEREKRERERERERERDT